MEGYRPRPSPQKLAAQEKSCRVKAKLKRQIKRARVKANRRAHNPRNMVLRGGGGAAGEAPPSLPPPMEEPSMEQLVAVEELQAVQEFAVVLHQPQQQQQQQLVLASTSTSTKQFSLHKFFGTAGPGVQLPVMVAKSLRSQTNGPASQALDKVYKDAEAKRQKLEEQILVLQQKQERREIYGSDGGGFGVLGGRPPLPLEDRRGVDSGAGIDNSNRRKAGQAKRKHELDAWQGLEICQDLAKIKDC